MDEFIDRWKTKTKCASKSQNSSPVDTAWLNNFSDSIKLLIFIRKQSLGITGFTEMRFAISSCLSVVQQFVSPHAGGAERPTPDGDRVADSLQRLRYARQADDRREFQ